MSAGHWPFAGICFQWTWVSLLPVGPWWLVSPRWSDSPYLLLVQHVFLRPAGSLTYSQTGWFALWSLAIGSFHCYPDNLLGNPPGIPPYGIPSLPYGRWGRLWGVTLDLLSSIIPFSSHETTPYWWRSCSGIRFSLGVQTGSGGGKSSTLTFLSVFTKQTLTLRFRPKAKKPWHNYLLSYVSFWSHGKVFFNFSSGW